MPFYKLRPGTAMAHNGTVIHGGTVIQLSREIAAEKHIEAIVFEVDATGAPVVYTPDEAILADELERARKHERVTLLEGERARVAKRLAQLDAAIAAELAPETPADSKE